MDFQALQKKCVKKSAGHLLHGFKCILYFTAVIMSLQNSVFAVQETYKTFLLHERMT